MFRNYLKTALRNLLKHKADSAINLVGLCVAFTSALLLFLSVQYEFSYDSFHVNRARLFHAYIVSQRPGQEEKSNSLPAPFPQTLKAEYPEVEYATRSSTDGNWPMEYGDRKLTLQARYVDADFLRMFSFPLLAGDAATALAQPTEVVMRAGAAKALFGSADPLGKTIRIQPAGEWRSYTVAGVVADPPANSSLNFDLLVPYEQRPDYAATATSWDSWNNQVYVQLREGVSAADFGQKTAPFMAHHFAQAIERLRRDGAVPAAGQLMRLGLQPLTDMHTDPELNNEGQSIGKGYLYLLLTVGALIVLIACINFINLSIGRSFTRTREIGLRKTLGALPWQLAAQFWCEVLLICLLAFGLSVLGSYLLLPWFRQTFGLSVQLRALWSPRIVGVMLLVFGVVTVLAGGYPVWLVARLRVADVLRGRATGGGSTRLRSALITTQFVIAAGLMSCTIIAWQQINFLRERPLGYNRHQIISIPLVRGTPPEQVLARLRHELAGQPGIVSLSGIYNNLGRGTDGSNWRSVMGFDFRNREIKSTWMGVSHDFVQTLDLQLLAGRDFSAAIASDSNAVVINEAMAAQLGLAKPVGARLPVNDGEPPMEVIGVVKDFNFESLHERIAPLTLVLDRRFGFNYVLVKVTPDNLPASLELVRRTWQRVQPNTEFNGSFLDENIERQYQHEARLGRMFVAGAATAIVLSCLGLLAIVILVLAQRTREIGIRKVLGASVASIVAFIARDFLRLVGLAILIASPLAWLVARRWLNDFSYRIDIQWWVFALAGLLTVAIAFLTVVSRTLQAATANPVKSLRTE